MPRVSIIIVNWNGREHLVTCLDSVAEQTYRDFETVVVDNGSTDGSISLLEERYPWVTLVPLSGNTGFARGNNIGLGHASGEYVVTLNNDTRVDPRWLETLVAVADAYPHAGMVGCQICSFDEPDVIDSIGHGVCRDGMSRGRFRLRRASSLALDAVEEILFPSACVALYRRAMIAEIGFFDDDFFAYAEDTDLGLRGRLAGWDAVVATNAVAYHKYSSTGGAFSSLKLFLVERNHYWVVVKNFPFRLLCLVPFFTVARYAAQFSAVISARGAGREFVTSGSRFSLILAVVKGTAAALISLPLMLKKRFRLRRTRKISAAAFAVLLQKYRLSFGELLDSGRPDEPEDISCIRTD